MNHGPSTLSPQELQLFSNIESLVAIFNEKNNHPVRLRWITQIQDTLKQLKNVDIRDSKSLLTPLEMLGEIKCWWFTDHYFPDFPPALLYELAREFVRRGAEVTDAVVKNMFSSLKDELKRMEARVKQE